VHTCCDELGQIDLALFLVTTSVYAHYFANGMTPRLLWREAMLPPQGARECGRFRVAQDLANLCRAQTGLAQALQRDVGAHPDVGISCSLIASRAWTE